MANKNVFSAANARVIPFIVFIVFMALEKVLHGATLPVIAQQLDLRWLYALRIGVVAATLAYFRRHYIELKLPTQVPLSQWMAAIAVGVGVFILWINLDQPWARMGESQGFNPLQPDGSLNIGIVAFRLAGSALVVPVMEELFWRSFILRWIDRSDFLQLPPAKVSTKAFWLTALLFASEHNLLLAGLLAGCAYNLLYMRTRSLWLPVCAHAITNGLLGAWMIYTHHWQFW